MELYPSLSFLLFMFNKTKLATCLLAFALNQQNKGFPSVADIITYLRTLLETLWSYRVFLLYLKISS